MKTMRAQRQIKLSPKKVHPLQWWDDMGAREMSIVLGIIMIVIMVALTILLNQYVSTNPSNTGVRT